MHYVYIYIYIYISTISGLCVDIRTVWMLRDVSYEYVCLLTSVSSVLLWLSSFEQCAFLSMSNLLVGQSVSGCSNVEEGTSLKIQRATHQCMTKW